MMIIGVDYHPSFQAIAFFVEETGECGEQELNHSDGQAEKFYRDLKQRGIRVRVGMEATGYSRWFERPRRSGVSELWIGDPAVKAKRVKKQKTDRNDARLLRRLMLENNFPQIWVPGPENPGSQATAMAPASLGTDAHADHESVAGVGHERGLSLEEKLFKRTRAKLLLKETSLAPWASRRRQSCWVLDRMNPTIEELTAAVRREAESGESLLPTVLHR